MKRTHETTASLLRRYAAAGARRAPGCRLTLAELCRLAQEGASGARNLRTTQYPTVDDCATTLRLHEWLTSSTPCS